MPRRRDDDDDDIDADEEEYDEDMEQPLDDEEEEEEEDRSSRKRRRSDFIDDVAEEDEDEEEEEEEEEEEDFGGGGRRRRAKRPSGSQFLDIEAEVDSDDDEEEDDAEDDFIVDNVADIPDEDDNRRMHRRPLLPREDEQEDVEALERRIQARYARSNHMEYDEETTEVEQQALLPSVRDPKLWMVKCAIGREREAAVCLMQKCIDRGPEMQIRSAVALDHLKNFIYIEADKEAHVREACKGLRNIYAQKITLVPIKEMTDVLSVESKAIDLSRDTWVRMKIGTYKGDLAKVVDVDNVRQRVTVKLIPRIDLQALANKLEGREVAKKKAFVPPPRFMNIDEARELHIRVERRRDPITGEYFENIGGMFFKDGFLYKTVSMKSISAQNIKPTFDELEKFRKPGENGDGDIASLSTLFANRKKGHFMKGDAVIVVKGDLKNLKGWVEKVEEENVHIRPEMKGLPKTLAVNERELCKYFEPGNHVKVVSGTQEGATGMVVKVDQHVLIILSDTTKEHIRVFADDVVESSEVTTGVTRIGDYELHDLVLLDNMSFGVIIRVETEAFQVLKGTPDRPEVDIVKLREIKSKIDKKISVQDRFNNTISSKDVVRILEGPCKGKQGPVEHIYRGILFIYDRHHLEHAGFICAKSQSCVVVGGSRTNGNRNGNSYSRFAGLATPPRFPQSPKRFPRGGPPNDGGGRHGRGGRGHHDGLVGSTVKVRQGPYKGYRGRVVEIKGQLVRVELESQMKVVTVDRTFISDNVAVSTPYRDASRYGMGSETPMHPSRTPLHPYMTPMRDIGTTPIHDGMRTPMRDRAWNPYAPMSPSRDNWEEGNPATWGASPQYQPGSPPSRTYEAPTPGSGWANTPGGSYSDAGTPRDSGSAYANAPSPYLPSTPGGQPMTPNSASYLPGTPGGQPMTPGTGGLDMMSPVIGGDTEGPWYMPDILVNYRRSGDDPIMGVIREVLPDGSCRIGLGSSGNGETVTAPSSEVEVIVPRKSDKIKIMGGALRGATGKLIGVDGTDGIVKVISVSHCLKFRVPRIRSIMQTLTSNHVPTHSPSPFGPNLAHFRLNSSPPLYALRVRPSVRPISAIAAPPLVKDRRTHSMPPEKIDVFKSLEGWASENVLPLLKPVDQCWQPQDFLPDSTLPYDEFVEEVRALRDRTAELPDEYFVVLVGDMITEDALPTYQTMINTLDGVKDETGASRSPWATWTRTWTAEENRHGDLLRTYLYLTGRVDMMMIERTVQYLIGAGMDPGTENNPYLGFVYTSFQERATFISHGNTARLAKDGGDPLLARICGTIASDEKRHENAYSRIVQKLLDVDPTGAMLAIADMMHKKITMPAHLMYDGQDPRLFDHFSAVAQRLGIYTANDYADILEVLIQRWRLEKVEGLTGEGRRAQDFVCGLAPRIRKLQERADERAKKLKPHGVKFSWIFNKEIPVLS